MSFNILPHIFLIIQVLNTAENIFIILISQKIILILKNLLIIYLLIYYLLYKNIFQAL